MDEKNALFSMLRNNDLSLTSSYRFTINLKHPQNEDEEDEDFPFIRLELFESNSWYHLHEFNSDKYEIESYQGDSCKEIYDYITVLMSVKNIHDNNRVYYKLDGNESTLSINNTVFSQLSEEHMLRLKNLYINVARKAHNNIVITEHIID